MQEVEGWLNGEVNYLNLRGDTGPLVYPAAFLYIFAGLYYLTDCGRNIRMAQWIFAIIYVVNLAIVMAIYGASSSEGLQSKSAPLWIWPLLVLSKRIHSIFVLRMFNDTIAVLLRLGCILYSLGVGVKMNMLLYAPGVFLVLLMAGGIRETVVCLIICGVVQLVTGYPFLSTFPKEYLSKAFELDRIFFYKWTVNYKFLDEATFVSKPVSLLLLALTATSLLLFGWKWIFENQAALESEKQWNIKRKTHLKDRSATSLIGLGNLNGKFIVVTILTSNFIGVCFARTLHYQFYSWYYHSLPLLLWHTQCSAWLSVALCAGIEVAFNVYPSTAFSSALLQICHLFILIGLYLAPAPLARASRSKMPTKLE
eukprot:GSChrysophyteH2.ASY1.ANO1.1157.1 assembled CDS